MTLMLHLPLQRTVLVARLAGHLHLGYGTLAECKLELLWSQQARQALASGPIALLQLI